MKYFSSKLVFKEVPSEISLAIEITGCPLRCKGCHSPHLRNHKLGTELTNQEFIRLLLKYKDAITCVVFLGGEWYKEGLVDKLVIAKNIGLKTALYTGEESVSEDILQHLNYLKTGPYIEHLGGLESPDTTNQKLIRIK